MDIKTYITVKNLFIFGMPIISFVLYVYGNAIPHRNLLIWLLLWTAAGFALSPLQIHRKNKTDSLFLIMFCLSLSIPTFHITTDIASQKEKRYLAVWEHLFDKQGKINFNFGTMHENFLKDRFLFRENLIQFYSNIIYRISIFIYKKDGYSIIKDGKYFLSQGSGIKITREDIVEIGSDFQTFQEYLTDRGIGFYVISFPTIDYLFKEHNIIYKRNKNISKMKSKYIAIDVVEKTLNEKYHINHIDMTKIFQDK